jgi:hypothetical protein
MFQMAGISFSQPFEFIYKTVDDEIICDALQDKFGNYYLIGSIGSSISMPPPQGNRSGIVIKLDSTGQLINSMLFSGNQEYTGLASIAAITDTTFLIAGNRIPSNLTKSLIYIVKIDSSLNIIQENLFGDYNSDTYISRMIEYTTDTLMFIGYSFSTIPQNNFDIIYGFLDSSGDSLSIFTFFNPNGMQMGFDLLKSTDSSNSLFLFTLDISGSFLYPLKIFKLNSNLAIDTIGFFPIHTSIRTVSAKWLSSDTFLAGSSGNRNVFLSTDKDLVIGKFNTNLNCIDTLFFGVADTNEHEAGYCLDFIFPDKIYLGGTKNSIIFFAPYQAFFYLISMDSSFNINYIKEINYHNDYLNLYKVLATKDGGVLLAGTKYNAATANGLEHDIYVIKLDSLGNFVTGTGASFGTTVHDFIVYPNPATTHLTLKYSPPKTTGRATVFNATGMKVSEIILPTGSHSHQLDISQYPSGLYLLKIETERYAGAKKFFKL